MITMLLLGIFVKFTESCGVPTDDMTGEVLIIFVLCIIGDILIFKRK